MNSSYAIVFAILIIGFVVYYLIKDRIFTMDGTDDAYEEAFHAIAGGLPSPAGVEIRQAPIYPPRQVQSSGPHTPNQAANPDEVTVYAPPGPTDPYAEGQESSEIPENLRHPERAFRPPPLNDQTELAVQAGIASQTHQVASDGSQQYRQEMISGGGEFMPGIFANDTTFDATFSDFTGA